MTRAWHCLVSSLLGCMIFWTFPSAAQTDAPPRPLHTFSYKTEATSDATVMHSRYPFTMTITHRGAFRYLSDLEVHAIGETATLFSSVKCSPREFSLPSDSAEQTVQCALISNVDTSMWVRLLSRTKSYPLEVIPKLAGGAQTKDVVISPFAQVRIPAGTLAVCAGGFAGAFLLVLFKAASQFLSADRAPARTRTWFRDSVRALPHFGWVAAIRVIEYFVFAARGSIVAMIVILITQSMGTLDIPIMIKVEDFYGGVVVGLFSMPLSGWLAEKLQGSKGDPIAERPLNHTAGP